MRLLLLLLLFCICREANSQVTLLKDINKQNEGSYPGNFFTREEKVYFSATEESVGESDLWIYDVITDSTFKANVEINQPMGHFNFILKGDYMILPQGMDSIRLYNLTTNTSVDVVGKYYQLKESNGKLFDYAFEESEVSEIEISELGLIKNLIYNLKADEVFENNALNITCIDGVYFLHTRILSSFSYRLYQINSNSGPNLLPFYTTSIENDNVTSFTEGFRKVNGKFVFVTIENNISGALWSTDGTTAGTTKIFDLDLPLGAYAAKIDAVKCLKGVLYFRLANNLYQTDGTSSGTAIIQQGAFLNNINLPYQNTITNLNSEIYYSKKMPDASISLRKFNVDTQLSTDVKTGFSNTPYCYIHVLERIFFIANNNELWITNGNQNGTNKLLNLDEEFISSLNITSNLFSYTQDSTKIVFKGRDNEPQMLSLLDSSIVSLKEINLVTKNAVITSGFQFQDSYKGDVLFTADDGINGPEFWVSDGTSAGTKNLFETVQGELGIYILDLITTDSVFYFIGTYNQVDYGIYRSEGTRVSTIKIADYRRETQADGRLLLLKAVGKFYYFNSGSLYVSDGTEEGTFLLLDIAFALPIETYITGEVIILRTSILESFISNGTLEGTKMINATPGEFITGFFSLKGNIYSIKALKSLSNGTPFSGFEILKLIQLPGNEYHWIVEKEIAPYYQSSIIYQTRILQFEDNVIIPFNTGGATQSKDFWTFDGSTLSQLGSFDIRSIQTIEKLDAKSLKYFITKPSNGIFDLWRTDGTTSGTFKLKELNNWTSNKHWYFEHNRRLYFSARNESFGSEMWVTDGTIEGTNLAHDIRPGVNSSFASNFILMGDWVFFSAISPGVGLEFHRLNLPCDGLLYSIQSGNWHDPSTWSCGEVPQATDYVIIKSGHSVVQYENTTTTFNGLSTEAGAVLEVKQGSTFVSEAKIK